MRQADRTRVMGTVTLELYGGDGALKHREVGGNLITDYGDQLMAERLYDDTANIVTGMRLGTGATAAAKAGAGGAIVTYESGSAEALDATATDSDKGAGSGHSTIYVCTWAAGDVTEAALAEVVLTNETPLTDVTGALGDTISRYVFAATINKGAADVLIVTWNIDHLGS